MRKTKDRFRNWLMEGSRSAEAFKISFCGLMFALLCFGVRDHGDKALNYVFHSEPTVRAQDMDAVILEAKKRVKTIEFEKCKMRSKTAGSLVKCLSEIN